jgi:hypothetical protein
MRKAMLLLAVFGLVGTVWAADPIIGTWKLNVAKSEFSPAYLAMLAAMKREAPKGGTEIYREVAGDQIELSFKDLAGESSSIKYIWPRQGGNATVQGGTGEVSYVETLVEPGEWYVTFLRDGKQLGVIHKTISKDGKTMRQIHRTINAEGKPYEYITVHDKQ